MEILLILVVGAVVCGGIGGYVSSERGRGLSEGLLFGLMLGPIGILIAALMPQVSGKTPQAWEHQQKSQDDCNQNVKSLSHEATKEEKISHCVEIERERSAKRQDEFDEQVAAMNARRASKIAASNAKRSSKQFRRARFYVSRGIKPGPFAAFYLLPEWLQPIAFVLLIAFPFLMLSMAFWPPERLP